MPREDLVDIRGGTAAQWADTDPTLAENEIAVVHADSGTDYWLLVGDGVTAVADQPRAGTRFDRARPDLQQAIQHTMLVDPDDDEANGIVFVRPSATAGDNGLENAWIVLDESGADAPDSTLARMDWAGGLGCQSAHFSPRADSPATQAVWVDPATDVVGVIVDTADAPGTADMIQGRWSDGTIRYRVNAGGAVLASGSYVFNGDDDTGIQRVAADTLIGLAGGQALFTLQRAGDGSDRIGFFDKSGNPSTKSTITGSRGGNNALTSLITALVNLGLVYDNTTAL